MVTILCITLCQRCNGGIAQIVIRTDSKDAFIAADTGFTARFGFFFWIQSL
jgi:hypothetical protein